MDYYEQLGVGEYWLFDSAGEFYGFTLRGYRLEEGRYRARSGARNQPRGGAGKQRGAELEPEGGGWPPGVA